VTKFVDQQSRGCTEIHFVCPESSIIKTSPLLSQNLFVRSPFRYTSNGFSLSFGYEHSGLEHDSTKKRLKITVEQISDTVFGREEVQYQRNTSVTVIEREARDKYFRNIRVVLLRVRDTRE
jgi:hypothetical protein